MRNIKITEIKKITGELLVKASFNLPGDIIEAIKQARKRESNTRAADMLDMIIKNAAIAADERLPLCQDCGSVYIDIEIGPDVCIVQDKDSGYSEDGQEEFFEDTEEDGSRKRTSKKRNRLDYKNLSEALNETVSRIYENHYLRKSIVDDPLFLRQNTGTNTPALISFCFSRDPGLGIEVNLKGGGSENCSWLFMLNPSSNREDITEIVTGLIRENVTRACPPVIIGIGIGGGASEVTRLARKATFRNLNIRNTNEEYRKMEEAILKKANESGIGPAGIGGKTTALACNIESAPCHMATLPLAVFFGCHSTRRAGLRY